MIIDDKIDRCCCTRTDVGSMLGDYGELRDYGPWFVNGWVDH